ncbi:MAG: hypothetical protein R2794_05655 [Chitinophagales bacterium]
MNKLILLCAPSGTGKTSIARLLCATDDRFHHVQVLTTRPIRPNEGGRSEKKPITYDELLLMNSTGELINFNEKDGVHYGIRYASIVSPISNGKFPVLEWDINNMNYWDDKFPLYKVILKPASIEHINESLNDGRDPHGLRKEGVLRELELINSDTLNADLTISNFDNALMDSVQLIRSSIFKTSC